MEKKLEKILKISVISLLLLTLAVNYFLTLAYDEAWLLSHYQEIYNGKQFLYKLAPNSMTAGGIFVVLGVILLSVFGMHVWIFRLVSFFSLSGISWLLWIWSKRQWSNKTASLIVLSCFLATFGTIELGGLAFATLTGMLLFLLGLHLMEKGSQNTNAIFAGFFFGLAASVRLNFLIIFPALLLEFFLFSQNRSKKLKEYLYILVIGIIVFSFFQLFIGFISPDSSNDLFKNSLDNVGLGTFWIDYPRVLNKWVVANGFFPFYLMVASSLFAIYDHSKFSRILKILMLFGWIHWMAWILLAPIAHLRYLWPTLASFGLIMGFGLASLYMWGKNRGFSFLNFSIILIAIALCTQAFVFTLRSLIHGETDIILWEWSRETPLSNYRLHRYHPNQKKIVEYLKIHKTEGEEIGTFALDLQIEILSGVKVVPLSYYFEGEDWKNEPLPRKILMAPVVGKYLYLDPALTKWIEDNLEKEIQFGDYILYNLKGHYPEKSLIFRFSHTPRQH